VGYDSYGAAEGEAMSSTAALPSTTNPYPEAEQVDIVKARLCALRGRWPTKAVCAEMALAERELDSHARQRASERWTRPVRVAARRARGDDH
jgi:hypothetical protein